MMPPRDGTSSAIPDKNSQLNQTASRRAPRQRCGVSAARACCRPVNEETASGDMPYTVDQRLRARAHEPVEEVSEIIDIQAAVSIHVARDCWNDIEGGRFAQRRQTAERFKARQADDHVAGAAKQADDGPVAGVGHAM